jgi:Carboxypeptidase regulatory-like domain
MRFRLALGIFMLAASVVAQTVSSTLKGTVLDMSGAVVPNAACKLTNTATNTTLSALTGPDGAFQFLDVLPGTYRLAISAPGFKSYELTALEILASEFHSAGNIVLHVGQASETLVVAETVAPVQLASGERSDTITGSQLNDIAVKGRDFVSYLSTLTGIIDTNASRDAMQRNALSGIHINGGRDSQALLVVDGMPLIDAGNNGAPSEPNMDAIAEVRVLLSNYQAEYGRNGGGTVTVISKTGTRNFHGSAYDYYRHESLNANNFFNNATLTPIAPYRYRMTGWSLGGPMFTPVKRDALRNKVFFFFSQELIGSRVNNPLKFQTMPSDLERKGNFSQSFNVNGALISVKDPLTKAQFPGNIIPANRFDPIGQAILNFYPLPNYTDPNPSKRYSYNYRAQFSGGWPRRQNLGRLDASPTPTIQLYYRVMDDYSDLLSPWGNWVNGSVNYDLTPISWDRPARTHTLHATKIFSPTMVDEMTVGKSFNGVYIKPEDPSLVERSRMGNPPQLFKDAVGQPDWLPGIGFGGTPSNTVNSSLAQQLPEGLPNTAYMFSNNLSKVWNKHQLKAGIYLERNHKLQPATVPYRGTYSFSNDGNNPGNTGHGFANALIGNFDTYQESNIWPIGSYLFWSAEWYVQDNWRVSRRLTLDYGMRFYHLPATADLNHTAATLDPRLYDPKQAPVLYRSGKDSSGATVAVNPLTGATAPAVYVGQFVPGVGNTADGARIAGIGGYAPGLYTTPSIAFGPRIGFAWDVFGNAKTSVRGGFGMFKDRVQGNIIYNASGNAPVTTTPTIYYGNFATLLQAASAGVTSGVAGPTAITQVYGNQPLPTIMNFSFGIQRQLGATVLDVAYAGSLNRHLPLTINLNPIPMFARFQPQNAGLTDNFLRPYQGYANVTSTQFIGTTNYNSLQASLRRRMSHGLQFGASYTFSKNLGTASADGDGISSYFSPRFRNYGPTSFNRTQVMSINYLYQLPKLGTRLGWSPAKVVFDDWQFSGITTFQTGAPFTPGFSTTDGADISGSTDAARIDVISNPYDNIAAGRYFNPAAFARPAKATFGNAGANVLYGPGINNWDLSLTKRVRFSESRALSVRGEAFNIWNHTQYSGLYTTAQFQPSGAQIDPNFGLPSAARAPRNVQLSARFTF